VDAGDCRCPRSGCTAPWRISRGHIGLRMDAARFQRRRDDSALAMTCTTWTFHVRFMYIARIQRRSGGITSANTGGYRDRQRSTCALSTQGARP
jgi:hypothetical protein